MNSARFYREKPCVHPSGYSPPVLVILALSGCHPKWYNGYCQTNDNCQQQPGFGKVCVLGHCQECGLDKDCKQGFKCRELRCVPRPECEVPIDCPSGKTCDMGKCVAARPDLLKQ